MGLEVHFNREVGKYISFIDCVDSGELAFKAGSHIQCKHKHKHKHKHKKKYV